MRIELKQYSYKITFEALDWLCIAERLSDWGFCGAWPEDYDYEREAVVHWAKSIYHSAAVSDRERFTLTMPSDWAGWLWKVVLADTPDDEFPWEIRVKLLDQIASQNRKRRQLPR